MVPLIEVLAPCRLNIVFARLLPIGHQLRVDKIMTHHPLHPIDIKIRKAKHRIADDDTFERYGSRIEDAEGQVRDIFACVGLARHEEGVVGVLWEF